MSNLKSNKREKQVTSLKLSKKLKKLGVKQESYWMWVKYEFWKKSQVWQSDITKKIKMTCLSGKREYDCSAFTVAELGEKLPKDFWVWKNNIEIRPNSDGFYLPKSERVVFGLKSEIELRDKSEANARAKMLIYLIENSYI